MTIEDTTLFYLFLFYFAQGSDANLYVLITKISQNFQFNFARGSDANRKYLTFNFSKIFLKNEIILFN